MSRFYDTIIFKSKTPRTMRRYYQYEFYAAIEENEIISACVDVYDTRMAKMTTLFYKNDSLKSQYEKRGLATALSLLSILFALSRDCGMICTNKMDEARKGEMYKKLGFEEYIIDGGYRLRGGVGYTKDFSRAINNRIEADSEVKRLFVNVMERGVKLEQIFNAYQSVIPKLAVIDEAEAKDFAIRLTNFIQEFKTRFY